MQRERPPAFQTKFSVRENGDSSVALDAVSQFLGRVFAYIAMEYKNIRDRGHLCYSVSTVTDLDGVITDD